MEFLMDNFVAKRDYYGEDILEPQARVLCLLKHSGIFSLRIEILLIHVRAPTELSRIIQDSIVAAKSVIVF